MPFALGQSSSRSIGPAFTRQILLTGQPVDAKRAYEMGMVHTVVPAAELEQATYDMARTIAGNAPLSLAGMKSIIRRAVSLRERLEHKDLDEVARRARASADAREGVRAMLEHRRPDFSRSVAPRSAAAKAAGQRRRPRRLHLGRRQLGRSAERAEYMRFRVQV